MTGKFRGDVARLAHFSPMAERGTNGARTAAWALVAALAILVAVLAPATAFGGKGDGKGKPAKPRKQLVYIFSLDGLDRDAVTKEDRAPFLSSLIDDQGGAHGTFFDSSLSVMVAETNPNHTSMITGAFPERHGIVGNAFATPGAGPTEDGCPAVPGGPPVVTAGESPSCNQAETAFTALERQASDKRYSTALIMGKPKLARLFASEDVTPGTFDADHVWAPCDPAEAEYCRDRPTNPVNGAASTDAIVMDEVIRTTRDGIGDAGFQRRPNFTFVNFPAIDTAGHTFGRTAPEYANAVGDASEQVERFVANQKELGIWKRTTMIMVSDHSMDDTPQFAKVSLRMVLQANGISDSDYEIVGNGGAAHVYLTDRSSPGAPELLKRMRAALEGSSAIDEVRYRVSNPVDGGDEHTIATAMPPWGLGGENSGDIVVSAMPGSAVLETSSASSFPFNPLQGNHGGTPTRDNFWLIAGGGKLVNGAESSTQVTNADAAPTALRLLGAKQPADAQAKPLKEAFNKKALKKIRVKR